jgi:hypothetical protein
MCGVDKEEKTSGKDRQKMERGDTRASKKRDVKRLQLCAHKTLERRGEGEKGSK